MTDQTPIQLHSLADITEALVRVLADAGFVAEEQP